MSSTLETDEIKRVKFINVKRPQCKANIYG